MIWLSLMLLGAVVVIAFQLLERLIEFDNSFSKRHFLDWIARGMFVPLLAWFVLNIGIGSFLPPFMPQVQQAQILVKNAVAGIPSAVTPWHEAMRYVGRGGLVIGTYWAAATFGWWAVTLFRKHPLHRAEFRMIISMWALGSLPIAAIVWFTFGLPGAGFAMALWLFPTVYAMAGLNPRHRQRPLCYSRAIAYMKFGKYTEAEMAVVQELEKAGDDFDGWMMLAELYATHFRDVAEAERTIRDVCNQPNITPSHVSVALHKLADWRLKLCDDPAAARAVLQEICRRFPDSHLAHMAALRMNQIPASADTWKQQRESRTIHLTAQHSLFVQHDTDAPADPEKLVLSLRERLTDAPDDAATRARLAQILAEQLGRVDDALRELEALFLMPDQSQQMRAEILIRMADWLIRLKNDAYTGRQLLERVTRDFSHTTMAFDARQRLVQLDADKSGFQIKPH